MSGTDKRAAFRTCMGEFATGVTVVTAQHEGHPAGMTVNAFCSVSLSPLLIMVALTEGSRTLEALAADGKFAVSVLARAQAPVAVAFAKRGAPFPAHVARRDGKGYWTVPGAVASCLCMVERLAPAGDHRLIVGEVVDFTTKGGDPLIFHRGAMGGLHGETTERLVLEGAAW